MSIKELLEEAKKIQVTEDQILVLRERIQKQKPVKITKEFLNRTYTL